MSYLERSREIVPLVPIRAMPGWMPAISQELKRYGEPRHESQSSYMADHSSTQRMQSKLYDTYCRDRLSRTRTRTRGKRGRRPHRDNMHPSAYEVPIVGSKGMLISLSIFYHFINNFFAGGAMAGNSSSNIPTPALAMPSAWTPAPAPASTASTSTRTSTAYTETTTNAQKRTENLLIVWKSSITYFCRFCRT